MAKARLRRGIEIIKLTNRIDALKMQEDEEDTAPGQADVPADAKDAARSAPPLTGEHAGAHLHSSSSSSPPKEKRSLSKIAKGAIFREVVFAKVKELKEQEKHAQMEKDAHEKAKKDSSGR